MVRKRDRENDLVMIRCGNRRKDNKVGKKCRGNKGKVNDGRSARMRIMCRIRNNLEKNTN